MCPNPCYPSLVFVCDRVHQVQEWVVDSQRDVHCPLHGGGADVEHLPEKQRNSSTASVAHAADVLDHTVRLFLVRVRGRIASVHPQAGQAEVNAGEGDHQGAWTPSTCERDVQSEEMSPLGSVHGDQENERGNTVAGKDVKGIQDVLDVLVRAPIPDDVQEEAHGDPRPYHALIVVHRGDNLAEIVVHGWAEQAPQVVAYSQEDNLDIQGPGIWRVTHVVAVAKQTSKGP